MKQKFALDRFKFPHRRAELVACLEEIKNSSPEDIESSTFDIDELVHFFFDDTDLFDDPKREIGYSIEEGELDSLQSMLVEFDQLVKELGDKPSIAYVSHPKWDMVKDLASSTLGDIQSQ